MASSLLTGFRTALPTGSAAWAQAAPSVLFLSASPAQPGKFERLKPVAAERDVRIEARFPESFTGQEKAGDFSGFDLRVSVRLRSDRRTHFDHASHSSVFPKYSQPRLAT